MAISRVIVPKLLRDKVLSEYNHRCSVCGADRPQIHHIDEDPNNNDFLNLLPLCPNHHFNDQHNPTSKIEHHRLRLFRRYKDPQILSSQFEPIYKRLRYLIIRSGNESFESLAASSADLVRFVECLEMGQYYGKALQDLLNWSYPSGYTPDQRQLVMAQHNLKYHERLRTSVDVVIEHVVEMLRYQKWLPYRA